MQNSLHLCPLFLGKNYFNTATFPVSLPESDPDMPALDETNTGSEEANDPVLVKAVESMIIGSLQKGDSFQWKKCS